MTRITGDTEPRTPVRFTEDVQQFGRTVARAGETGETLFRPFGPHATANGGGWDVPVVFEDGRRFPGFAPNFEKDAQGRFLIIEESRPYVVVHSRYLEII